MPEIATFQVLFYRYIHAQDAMHSALEGIPFISLSPLPTEAALLVTEKSSDNCEGIGVVHTCPGLSGLLGKIFFGMADDRLEELRTEGPAYSSHIE